MSAGREGEWENQFSAPTTAIFRCLHVGAVKIKFSTFSKFAHWNFDRNAKVSTDAYVSYPHTHFLLLFIDIKSLLLYFFSSPLYFFFVYARFLCSFATIHDNPRFNAHTAHDSMKLYPRFMIFVSQIIQIFTHKLSHWN